MIILVESDHASSLISVLDEKFYKPSGFRCAAQVCSPSEGSSVVIP